MLKRHFTAGVLLGFLVAGFMGLQPAFAFTKGACMDDAKKLCPDSKGPASRDCLKQHESELSDACKENMAEMKEKKQEVEAACKPDVQKFCSDIKPGEGRIRHCLKAHQPDLSAACQQTLGQGRHKMHPDAAASPAAATNGKEDATGK